MEQGGKSMKKSQHYQNDCRSFGLGRARAKERHKCPGEETETVRGPLGGGTWCLFYYPLILIYFICFYMH